MADVNHIVSVLLDDYDNAIGARQCDVDDAIAVTEQLIEELQARLQALQDDKNSDAGPA